MSTTQIVILVVVIVACVFGAVAGLAFVLTGVATDELSEARDRTRCLNNLKTIGLLLELRKASGELKPLEGAAYLLQVVPDVKDEDLGIFVCPGAGAPNQIGPEFVEGIRGPDGARFCSYRGMNNASTSHKSRIVACDANGPDGTAPHHADGVCVLFQSGIVRFVPWSEMAGYDGDPVPVGPDSPDTRFRHLVR